MTEHINEPRETKFTNAFFKGKTFDEGIAMAGKALCISPIDTLNYFMTYDPINPHDITSSYIFACRYKRHHDNGINCGVIAEYLGCNRTLISSSVKIAEVFGPADIKSDLVFSDYRKAAYTINPKKALNRIRNTKREKAANSISRFGEGDAKKQFIIQSQKAYEMHKNGIDLEEIARVLGVSRKQVNMRLKVGAIPPELLQRSRFEDIKRATQAMFPESYLLGQEKKYAESKKDRSLVLEDQIISSETSKGLGTRKLRRLVFMVLNVLLKNQQINKKQLTEINPGIYSENRRLKLLVASQEKEIAKLEKHNKDLQKGKKRCKVIKMS